MLHAKIENPKSLHRLACGASRFYKYIYCRGTEPCVPIMRKQLAFCDRSSNRFVFTTCRLPPLTAHSDIFFLMRIFDKNLENNFLIRLASYALLLGIILITLLSIISSFRGNFLLELFSHFKIQYFVLNFLLFGLLVLARKQKFTVIGLFCLSIVLAEIVPWYIPHTNIGINNPTKLRVLSSNINNENQRYSQVLSLVRQEKPDIAIFMEINQDWVKQLDSLKDILPYTIAKANPYNLGIAVYSKHPLKDASLTFFGTSQNPSIVGNLDINGQIVSLIAAHPPPPIKSALFKARNQQLNEIGKYIKSLKTRVIMVGDFNITMWSPYYKQFISKAGLKNARKGFGIVPTWPSKTNYPPYSKMPSLLTRLLSIPIDHCLVSPGINVAKIRAGSYVGSDHRPLITDLVIPEKKT